MLRVLSAGGRRGSPWRGSRAAALGALRRGLRAFALGAMWPALAVALLGPASLNAQDPDCRLVRVGGYTKSVRFDSRFGPSDYRHYASGGVDYRCSDGTRVYADSAMVFEFDNQVQLYGNVLFEDVDTELLADSAIYFSGIRQLRAISNVQVTDRASGTVIRGDNLTYDQASEFRTLDRIFVYGGQPRATFFLAPGDEPGDTIPPAPVETDTPGEPEDTIPPEEPAAAAGEAPPPPGDSASGEPGEPEDTIPPVPYEVTAERLRLDGRRHFRAGGSVVIVRDSLRAFGDSLDYDREAGAMVVLGGARFLARDHTLTGASISLTPAGPRREEILAREDARLSGEQFNMSAPAIRVFSEDGAVVRLVALAAAPPPVADGEEIDTRGLSPGDAERARELAGVSEQPAETEVPADSLPRPILLAEGFQLVGDSIEAVSPAQRLERVTAVGNARTESIEEDSLPAWDLPEFARRDWMEGDTIVAHFSPPQGSDSTAATEPPPADAPLRLHMLVAIGEARSFRRMAASDTTAVGGEGRPALHLVEGDQITIHLDGREIVNIDVVGQTAVWHFEPEPPDSAATDTTGVKPDSATADTTGARPGSRRR